MTLVVKIGGAAGNRAEPLLDELAERRDCVLVHGGSAEVDRLERALGRAPEYYTSPSGVVSRRTDAAHLEVLVLALAGAVQTDLVSRLAQRKVRAIGLSGVDAGLVRARKKEGVRARVGARVVRLPDDRSGSVEGVDGRILRVLLAESLLPVVGPPAVAEDGRILNVDADRVAAAVAVELRAEALVLLTNVPGLLRSVDDATSLIPHVARSEIDGLLPVAAGRMRKKVLAARDALDGGVPRVAIAFAGEIRPVAQALAGKGTVFE
ncbi:MAG: [LysW]-aminoadipate kinase [Thermoplasmata archaeon]